jgi:hypothetical protein
MASKVKDIKIDPYKARLSIENNNENDRILGDEVKFIE